MNSPIGIFDSGYGGLTILQQLRKQLPDRDFIYLGDNARAPYGSRSFDVVYEFTRQAVMTLFSLGCRLVILGCNTASAKALRTIQQNDLTQCSDTIGDGSDRTLLEQGYRVLGVIRPTVEVIGQLTESRHVGVVATEGTVRSESYNLEIAKFYPDIQVTGQACPLWAAIVEAGESESEGADFFVRKRITQLLAKDPLIDTIILGCTHYPLLMNAINKATPQGIRIVPQGEYVARSLDDYLRRHPDMDRLCSTGGTVRFYTTESPERFKECASIFLHTDIDVEHINLSA
ncbi:MAG: aspartate/glutamate racemase family protein [Prevotella sp.]|nr:aspartate/glutamate racemase family protein [Prevotella sp.]MBR4650879.1 aspartate/glutamate racemase family protein [Prevotella sp.]